MDIDIHTLESVLSRETLNCKEIHIWNAALRWASAECIRQDLEPTPVNQRKLLGKKRMLYVHAHTYTCAHTHTLCSYMFIFEKTVCVNKSYKGDICVSDEHSLSAIEIIFRLLKRFLY